MTSRALVSWRCIEVGGIAVEAEDTLPSDGDKPPGIPAGPP